jgi:hypothetical protein
VNRQAVRLRDLPEPMRTLVIALLRAAKTTQPKK